MDFHGARECFFDLLGHRFVREGFFAGGIPDGFQEFFHRDVLEPDAETLIDLPVVGVAGDQPVGGFPDDSEAGSAEFFTRLGNPGEFCDPAPDGGRGAVDDLALQALLPQIGKDFHRGGEGVALAGGQQVEAADAARRQFGQERLENALRAACAHENEVQRPGSETGEIAAGEVVAPFGENVGEEAVGDAGDGRFVMQCRGQGIDRDRVHARS